MNDKLLNILLRVAVVFLALSAAFCIFTVVYTNHLRNEANQQRIETEDKMAEIDLEKYSPTAPPAEEEASGEEESEPIEVEPDEQSVANAAVPASNGGRVIVLDAGHGKSSSAMSSDEKTAEGYEYNESRGTWGEWRHYKDGTFGEDCHGSGCTLTHPSNGSCWYPMGNADRDTEPEVNLNNALAAQRYLEGMGYEVRMTRTSNDQNPSMNKRVSYCFPNNDISQNPDAALYVCIHSNAGGGRGTGYIALSGDYRQSFIPSDYVEKSNAAGSLINQKVAAASGLNGYGSIGGEGYLILFNKSPVPIAYLEIGFYDSSADLAILQSSSDEIGKAIAEGVDEFLASN